jgi:hypothetical protein
LAMAFQVAWITAALNTNANAAPVTGSPYGHDEGTVNSRIMTRGSLTRSEALPCRIRSG